MTARRLSTLCFYLTIACTLGVIGVRLATDPGALMSSQTMVLVFPVFMAMMTRKGERYPRMNAMIAMFAFLLAAAALALAIDS
jgi:hypothetical protein